MIGFDYDAITGNLEKCVYSHKRQRDFDYTLLTIDPETETVLWKDESTGGLVYQTFDNNTFDEVVFHEFGIGERIRDMKSLLGLEDK